MKAVLQRVVSARVEVDGVSVGEIDHGLLVYVGVAAEDEARDVAWMAEKVAGARIFQGATPQDEDKMTRDVRDVGGAILVISQFTLLGDLRKGRRPNFSAAMEPVGAERLYESFVADLRAREIPVKTGRFRADMKVTSRNDGPVTLVIESPNERDARIPGAPPTLSSSG
ncbi:MAG: D-aminoacyl-tRNA deacylase [Polyangiales bacterium]